MHFILINDFYWGWGQQGKLIAETQFHSKVILLLDNGLYTDIAVISTVAL